MAIETPYVLFLGDAADQLAAKTGQTGILIAGDGVSVDAVIADFISGATEWMTPANDSDHWDLVEGQGSLFHVSYAGVSLGLLHGTQPDALVLCHEPTRTHRRGIPAVDAIRDGVGPLVDRLPP